MTNDFHDLLVNRRSIRRYTEQSLAPDQVRLILEAALLAPTSKNSRSWQFVAVDDKEMLSRLSECKDSGAGPIKGCALAVVVLADPSKTDPWIEDASIAASYMQLQAAALGLGSCWIQVRDRFRADGVPASEFVAELLGIPEQLPVECIITFGYKAEERKPADTAKLFWEKVHIGSWKAVEE
ncbi:MAG: NAD(P)H nitroreductase [Barnesiella sp.]|nr:NAD(P)H nitroreductase [Barnesiella sp.]